MQQQTLFGGSIEDTIVEEEVEEDKPISTETDEEDWKAIGNWLNECKENKENHMLMKIWHWKVVKVDGSAEEGLESSLELERNFKGKNDSYGGMWRMGGSGTWQEVFDTVRNEFQNEMDSPYVPYDENYTYEQRNLIHTFFGHFISEIKTENHRLFVSKKAYDYCKRNDIPIDDFIKEIEQIKTNRRVFTPDFKEKMEYFVDLDAQREEMESELRDIVWEALNGNKVLDAFVKPEEIIKKVNDLKQQLTDIEEEFQDLHKFFYDWEDTSLLKEEYFLSNLKKFEKKFGE